jgi:hypothetical protein
MSADTIAPKTLVPEALEKTPREAWHTSACVSRALLNCPKVKQLVRMQILRKNISLDRFFDDAMAEVVAVMQINMMPKLAKIDDVYFVVYRVAELVAMGLSRKDRSEIFGPVRSFSDLANGANAEDGQEDMIERIMDQSAHVDGTSAIEDRIDQERAKANLAKKLKAMGGWPSEIPQARKTMGRPRGSTKAKAAADAAASAQA